MTLFSLPPSYTYNWHSSLPFDWPNSPSAKTEGGKKMWKVEKTEKERKTSEWDEKKRKTETDCFDNVDCQELHSW